MKKGRSERSPKRRIFLSFARRDAKPAREFLRSLGSQFEVRQSPSSRKLRSKATSLERAYYFVENEIRHSDIVVLLLPRKPSLSYSMAYEAGLAKAMEKEVVAIAPYENWAMHETLLGLSKPQTFTSASSFVSSLKGSSVGGSRMGRAASKAAR